MVRDVMILMGVNQFRGPLEGVGPEMAMSEYRIQNTEAHVLYIKLPMYLFFHMALGLNDFDGGNPFRGPLEGLGPKNLDFFGPKWHSRAAMPDYYATSCTGLTLMPEC